MHTTENAERNDYMHRAVAKAVELFYLRPKRPGKLGRPPGASVGERSVRPSRGRLQAPMRYSRGQGRPPSYAPSAADQIEDPMWRWLDPPWSPPLDGIPGELHVELCWLREQAERVNPAVGRPLGHVWRTAWLQHFGVSRGAKTPRARATNATRTALADTILGKLVAAGWARVVPHNTGRGGSIIELHPRLVLTGKPSLPDDPDQDPGPWPP